MQETNKPSIHSIKTSFLFFALQPDATCFGKFSYFFFFFLSLHFT